MAEAGTLAQMGLGLLQQQRWAEAEMLICQSLAIREKMQPGAWTIARRRPDRPAPGEYEWRSRDDHVRQNGVQHAADD